MCYIVGMGDQSTINQTAWLEELKARRIALKRQLFAADAQSATISAGTGSRSYTNRSVAELKAKIAACESEIAAVCAELGVPLPFKTTGGVAFIRSEF